MIIKRNPECVRYKAIAEFKNTLNINTTPFMDIGKYLNNEFNSILSDKLHYTIFKTSDSSLLSPSNPVIWANHPDNEYMGYKFALNNLQIEFNDFNFIIDSIKSAFKYLINTYDIELHKVGLIQTTGYNFNHPDRNKILNMFPLSNKCDGFTYEINLPIKILGIDCNTVETLEHFIYKDVDINNQIIKETPVFNITKQNYISNFAKYSLNHIQTINLLKAFYEDMKESIILNFD